MVFRCLIVVLHIPMCFGDACLAHDDAIQALMYVIIRFPIMYWKAALNLTGC